MLIRNQYFQLRSSEIEVLHRLLPFCHTRKTSHRGGYEECRLLVQYDGIGAAIRRVRYCSVHYTKYKSKETHMTR